MQRRNFVKTIAAGSIGASVLSPMESLAEVKPKPKAKGKGKK